jgi:hypothetical protein
MSAHLLGLPLGQPDEPDADLAAAIAKALKDAELLALADQIADAMIEQISLAGPQHFLQSAVAISVTNGELPAAVLQRALNNTLAEAENAKVEIKRSDCRLAQHVKLP